MSKSLSSVLASFVSKFLPKVLPKKATKKATKKASYNKNESKKYSNPVASREQMLEIIQDHHSPVTFERMVKLLKYKDEDKIEGIRRRLIAMVRDGQLIRNRRDGYLPIDPNSLVTGSVIAHPDGFGFLKPDDGSKDLFIYPSEMRALMHGDRVVARIGGTDKRGRKEAKIVNVIDRANKIVVGRFYKESDMCFVTPDSKKLPEDIIIHPKATQGAQSGQVVEVRIRDFPTKRHQAIGKVNKVLGDHLTPGMEIDIAITNYALPNTFSKQIEKELTAFSSKIDKSDIERRRDIRDMTLVTIDGDDSKDFDDAVFCEPTKKGWKLTVAIADVAHYVTMGSALDQEAIDRGTSVYFPGRVIPMLPEKLSNGLCSINPDEDRYALCCEMEIDSKGNVTDFDFFEGVMKSHARLTYNQVSEMLNDADSDLHDKFSHVVSVVNDLNDLYHQLLLKRKERGGVEFDRPETKIVFNEDKKIDSIICVERFESHKIIEECMILANIACAKFMDKNNLKGLYRNHLGPEESKLAELRKFLALQSLDLPGGNEPSAKDYSTVLNQLEGRADAHIIQTVLLRSLKQANYHSKNVGHFGLSLDYYGHFTSPIRRYPDLVNHRLIKAYINKAPLPYTDAEKVGDLGTQCSGFERRADEATRDVTDWLKCEYMEDKVGTIHNGVINTVTSFGLFVELDDIFVEGLVHVTSLPKDYYQFDATLHKMIGERTGQTFQLGDTIRVEVANVDLESRKMDFKPVE